MKLCGRVVNFIQLINAEGDICVCSRRKDNVNGFEGKTFDLSGLLREGGICEGL